MSLEQLPEPYRNGDHFAEDVFAALEANDLDTAEERHFNFFLYLPTQETAEASAALIREKLGLDCNVDEGEHDTLKWLAWGEGDFVPTKEKMAAIGQLMLDLQTEHGGEFDGWDTPVSGMPQLSLESGDDTMGAAMVAMLMMESGQYEKAAEIYAQVIPVEQDPDAKAEALLNRSAALHNLARYDEAIASANEALTINPEYGSAHYNLANAYCKLDDREKCRIHLQRAIHLKPEYLEMSREDEDFSPYLTEEDYAFIATPPA